MTAISNAQKIEIVNAFAGGNDISHIANHYGISRVTVERTIRESIVGLSALLKKSNTSPSDSLIITEVQP